MSKRYRRDFGGTYESGEEDQRRPKQVESYYSGYVIFEQSEMTGERLHVQIVPCGGRFEGDKFAIMSNKELSR